MSNTKSNQTTEILNLAKASLVKLKQISKSNDFNFPEIKKLCSIKVILDNLEKIQSIDYKNLNSEDEEKYNAILTKLTKCSFGIYKENKFEKVTLNPIYRDDYSGTYQILGLKEVKENIEEEIEKKVKENIEEEIEKKVKENIEKEIEKKVKENIEKEIEKTVKELQETLEQNGLNENDYKLEFEITNENLRKNLQGNDKSNQNVNLNEVEEVEQKIGQNVGGNSFNKQ